MAAILRKLRPTKTSSVPVNEEDDAFNVEYSIALEYHGPPVTYNIPHAAPVDFDHIPTAAAAAMIASASPFNGSSVPVIQPIMKRKPETGPEAEPQVVIRSNSNPRLTDSILQISGNLQVPDDISGAGEEADEGFEDYMNPTNWESTESGLSSRSLSSEVFSHKAEDEDCGGETPHHVRRVSVVTFRDPDSNDVVENTEWSESGEVQAREERPIAVRTGKKGSCYRCDTGNRFTGKELCIVCGAKYCSSCVLRAMGSMPEGRKCVTCIGHRVDERNRWKLGKRSRLLKRLLTDLEVEQIMKSELLSKANQLPANLVFVNDEALNQEELVRLQGCSNPPRKLKPGSYWYDNVSGFWGKQGRVYSQIISPQLNIGGHIKKNASNGNTNIMINNREITKTELGILRLAGVPCEGNLHYWVDRDGSYQEEGMNNVKGKIWDKVTVKIACAFLSLPIPSDSSNPSTEEGDTALPPQNQLEEKMVYKFLLVGSDQCGTSTIFKQAKFLYNVPFTEDERQNIKWMIQAKLYSYLGILLEGRDKFEEECLFEMEKEKLNRPGPSEVRGETEQTTIYSISQRLKAFSDWLLKVMASGNLEAIFPAATREYAQFVEDLWNDPAIQETYNRRNELEMLPRNATYFLNRAIEISRTDYTPSDMDILYAEGITSSNSVASVEFSCPKMEQESMVEASFQRDALMRCQLIRVHPRSLGENCKWLQMFEDVDIVLFCISLSDYAEFVEDGNGGLVNKMMASKQLFESIVTHPSFEKKEFLVLLNKYDLLEEKIERVPLSFCEWFQEFQPAISYNPSSSSSNTNNTTLAHRAFQYVAMKFKRLFHSLTDRKLFVSLINGLESETVEEALKYGGEILKWVEDKPKMIADQQISSTSIEASSSS
ncbi:extra-large guanine nucleotide-binding protein 1-like [Humulus lupulus]|uniref:extra-large guanine nucleotide-binding protein 1-like n=1 Tax=Humulus lupulus TaxID=3486 RepID=UPI002B40C632|nr:extra-large guanine nucleotide-binding protein 1-like [Humulus lupulus]